MDSCSNFAWLCHKDGPEAGIVFKNAFRADIFEEATFKNNLFSIGVGDGHQ
jgi:hypothetical protein